MNICFDKKGQFTVNDYTIELGKKLKGIILGFLLENKKFDKETAYFYYRAIITDFVVNQKRTKQNKVIKKIEFEGKTIIWQQICLILIQKPYFVFYSLKRDGIIFRNNTKIKNRQKR